MRPKSICKLLAFTLLVLSAAPAAAQDSPFELIPSMIGDGLFGHRGPGGAFTVDSLLVPANDLDAPNPLPAGNMVLTISEAGPVGIFDTSVLSVQEIQTLLRNSQPVPAGMQVGMIADNATLTSSITVAEIQALLGSTAEDFDIIPIAAPPGSYDAAVDAVFIGRNGAIATTTYNAAASGALLQTGDALTGGEDLDAFYFYTYSIDLDLPNPGAAAVRAGQTKIANGGTPMPQNRIYFQYNYYANVGLTPAGEQVHRFVPGFEWAILGPAMSLEIRFPFAAAIGMDVTSGPAGITAANDALVGDIPLYLKFLLYAQENMIVSGGLAVTFPTADDFTMRLSDGTPFLHLEHDAFRVGPFLGGMYVPSERFFAQGFAQLDFATSGNGISIHNGTDLAGVGDLSDPSYLFLDGGVGYWLSPRDGDHPIALMGELHYTTLVTDDRIRSGTLSIGSADSGDILNATVGASVGLLPDVILTAGYVAPLTDGARDQYDAGARVQVEYRPR